MKKLEKYWLGFFLKVPKALVRYCIEPIQSNHISQYFSIETIINKS